jgi:hypothetical protein
MAYTLRYDEMLEAARMSNMPGAEEEIAAAEAIATRLAHQLAAHLGVDVSDEANLDMAILGAWFAPAHDGQPMPAALEGFDNEDEWED